jgi:5'-nucleotidase (lipoprotein e(P4) family)
VAFATACATPAPRAPAAPPPPAAVATPRALPDDIRWVQDSAEYRAACAQAYALATHRVEELAAGRAAGTWAVSLDLDETVISNVGYEVEMDRMGLVYDEETWSDWVRRREATALPGAVAFLRRVRALGGRIAIVSNHDEAQREATRANLDELGVPYDLLLLRPRRDQGSKVPRWEAIENGTAAPGVPPMKILLYVGDNILDFPGEDQSLRDAPAAALSPFGDRFIVIPTPLYGSWKTAVPRPTPASEPMEAPGASAPPAPTARPAPAATPPAPATAGPALLRVTRLTAMLEKSLPAKLQVVLGGTLADGCVRLGTPTVERDRRTFHVRLPALRDAGKACTQAIVPFERNVQVDISGLASGTYTVEAAGTTTTFTLEQDN